MPFTLAHPAAVLPLKRFCPRWLSFNALVVGSLVPDAGYCFRALNWDELSHSFVGSFVFCLPAGLLMLMCIYGLRGAVVNVLPVRQRQLLLSRCWQPPAPPLILIISILIGTCTHVIWDSLTHSHSWMVSRLPLLQIHVATVHDHRVEVCHLLWYASSFAGVAWLCFNYERRLHTAIPTVSPVPRAKYWSNAMLVGMLVLPIEAIHQLVHGLVGIALVGVCSLMLILGMALKIGSDIPAP